MRWGLVPSHDLTAPFAVSGPLEKKKVTLRHHTARHTHRRYTYIDTNEGRRALADWSGRASAAQRHVVARCGADNWESERDVVVYDEENGHV